MKMLSPFICCLFFVALVAIDGCQSSKNNDPKVTPGTGDIALSVISPESPYIDDEITLAGSGFDPDPAKDTVEFGDTDGTNFYPFIEDGKQIVVSTASANELKVHASDPAYYDSKMHGGDTFAFRVRTNGKLSAPVIVNMKKLFRVDAVNGTINTPIHPDEHFKLYGIQFTAGCTMSLTITKCQSNTTCNLHEFSRCDCDESITVPCDASWAGNIGEGDNANGDWNPVIPQSLLGSLTNDCPFESYDYQTKFTVTNGDGKKASGFIWIQYRVCK